MRMIRMVYRLVRLFLLLYGVWTTIMRSRWLAIALAVFRLWRRRRAKKAKRTAALQFVHAGDPAIYKRQGWRRIKWVGDEPDD